MPFSKKYFWLIIIFGVVLAFVWPAPGLIIKPFLSYLLMLMMFLSCLKIDWKELKAIPAHWWRYLIMICLIFVLPTGLVWIITRFLPVSDLNFVGLVLAAAIPCGISVVFITDLLDGEPSKALVSTTLAHLLAPLITPFLVWVVAHQIVEVSFGSMFILIIKLAIIPLILAQIVRYLPIKEKLIKFSNHINTYLLILLLWGIVSPVIGLVYANWLLVLKMIVMVVIISWFLFVLGIWFGRDDKEDITWAVVSIFKNFTLSSVLALSLFGEQALLGSIAYGLVSNLAIAPLQFWAVRRLKNKH